MARAKTPAKKTDPEVRRERPGPTKTDSAARRSDIDELLAAKRHPLEEEIRTVRRVILGVDASIREEIKWSSVSFRNEHDFFATVNLRSTESVQRSSSTRASRRRPRRRPACAWQTRWASSRSGRRRIAAS